MENKPPVCEHQTDRKGKKSPRPLPLKGSLCQNCTLESTLNNKTMLFLQPFIALACGPSTPVLLNAGRESAASARFKGRWKLDVGSFLFPPW